MRKAKPRKHVILPDPVFGDVAVTKFVNHLMYDGKKNTSFEIFYESLDKVKAKPVSPERCEIIVCIPARCAISTASSVSVRVPI